MRAVGRFLLMPLILLGCSERARQARQARPGSDAWLRTASVLDLPDERPQILNGELPFRYPVASYAAGVQGEVLLRVFVDSGGTVVADSLRLVERSGHPALDSAALAGATRLRFRAARRGGAPIAVSRLFPVHFKRPGALTPRDSLRPPQ
jgi:TonB family protein